MSTCQIAFVHTCLGCSWLLWQTCTSSNTYGSMRASILRNMCVQLGLEDRHVHAGSSGGDVTASVPGAVIPVIQGNASCSVTASVGNSWEHGNGTWRGAVDLVGPPALCKEAAFHP